MATLFPFQWSMDTVALCWAIWAHRASRSITTVLSVLCYVWLLSKVSRHWTSS
jgi:hypothetical protein